ncbi:MAG: hypothetical protein CL975_01675 [Euryarchaeota archaeon]|nr:hypothetical protein [Euryarchaeota archaeon]
MGCPVDGNSEDSIEVEVFPDRPDLLSHEAIARASRTFLSKAEVDVNLPVISGEIGLTVSAELADVRPIVLGAVVRGVDTGSNTEEREDFIQSLMDHQEKLHLTLGRKRKFAHVEHLRIHLRERRRRPFMHGHHTSSPKGRRTWSPRLCSADVPDCGVASKAGASKTILAQFRY